MRVAYFQIPAHDSERAIGFYDRVFGWQFDKKSNSLSEYCVVKTGRENEAEGIDGGLTKRNEKVQAARNMINVPSIDEYTTKISSEGGKVLIPKSEIPNVGYWALCRDTEENVFCIMQTVEQNDGDRYIGFKTRSCRDTGWGQPLT
jgi:uncharacterized protein